jgi:hypothetical protein|tara:strand:- start:4021 stop:4290 length:270 start_codon:yes stop_codon:yes gene_type:complete
MGNLRKGPDLSLEDVATEAVIWCNEMSSRANDANGCRIVIIGGSEEEASNLCKRILELDSDVLVDMEEKGYSSKEREYGIDLNKITLGY